MNSRMITILVTIVATTSLIVLFGPSRSATPVLGAGADKIAISASNAVLVNPNQQPNATASVPVKLATATFTTSTTEDLVMNFSTECGIYTAVGGKNNNTVTGLLPATTSSTAVGQVQVYLMLDGNLLPVSASAGPATFGEANTSPNGPVSYCDRALQLNTSNLSPQQLIAISINTLDANSFQWFALNVGNGAHTLEVWANLIANTASSGTNGGTGSTTCGPTDPSTCFTTPAASAIVGQRTLEVFPDHLANTASF